MAIPKNQRGQTSMVLISLIAVSSLFLLALIFAVWAFSGRQNYKNNVDQLVATAKDNAVKQTQAEDAKALQKALDNPFATYTGPEAYGSVIVKYPKTWSAYVDTTNGSTPINAYFEPNIVPGIGDAKAKFALRVQIVQQSYDSVANQYQNTVKSGKLQAKPYQLAQVPGALGVGERLDGQLTPSVQGSLLIVKLRDKTLKVWTEDTTYMADFNTVLQSLTFSP